MSDKVPARTSPEQFPYCFWDPRYQVGRACVVGGYTTLYHELRLLPEVAIAEGVRDNRKSGHAIYEVILKAPVGFAKMDDHNYCLRAQPLAALLYTPLPAELPTVDKDLLILMATWSGNIDSYGRLQQPRKVEEEMPCIIRGIHHHPLFAKWWLMRPRAATNEFIRRAIHSRCSDLPDLIWYPQVAHKLRIKNSCAGIRRRHLQLRESVSTQTTKTYLLPSMLPPDNAELVMDAKRSRIKCYEAYLKHKASECGIDLKQFLEYDEDWAGKKPYAMLDQDRIERG
ncbi:uncharacterized protein BDW70DRAFT_165214 [Aspergillus foveolatus]|uniref:uncharacterized protein n=1 Tax=Aspergillus foveolatus TaxID=210207 RepID=UPI003CCD74BA